MAKTYNHLFIIGFTVSGSSEKNALDIGAVTIRRAIKERLDDLNDDDELMEAVCLSDTYEEKEVSSPLEINVGDKVRSYDFSERKSYIGDHACFVDGIVEEIKYKDGCYRYIVKPTRRVWAGQERLLMLEGLNEVCPPINGVPIAGSDRVTDGVIRIE